jgi:predicted secreted protein
MVDHFLDESGGEVSVRPGDRIHVTVTENASTGYVWEVDSLPDGVVPAGSTHEPGEVRAPGQAGQRVFVFDVTIRVRTGDLLLVLKRTWEPEPVNSVSVHVVPARNPAAEGG